MTTIDHINKIKIQSEQELKDVRTPADLAAWEIKYLGRKQGQVTQILHKVSTLPQAQRREVGGAANQLKRYLEKLLADKRAAINIANEAKELAYIDVTLPGVDLCVGGLHPITKTQRELEDIFVKLGFTVVEGPELETDYYNFEALNMPKGHPARDMWDTFYVKSKAKGEKSKINEQYLLRTHTSPMQVRIMEKYKPPLAVIVPGRVFRHEATDARHEHTFDQLEGLAVASDLSVAEMKYTLHEALSEYFGKELRMQLRPSYFPFVEPGFEIAVECTICGATGCATCSGGWLELLGAGMVHPRVFESAGYKRGQFTGFAFGLGLSRFAMIKYGIADIRLFAENDYEFLKQT